jgi:hypothetical protein
MPEPHMSNEFFDIASNLMSGALSAKVTVGRSVAMAEGGVSAMPRESRPENTTRTDERLDQLLLVCTAMWQLIKEKTNLTEEDLVNRIAILDAQDGVADGKLNARPQPCPKCRRTLCVKRDRCLYCGFQLPTENVFKSL